MCRRLLGGDAGLPASEDLDRQVADAGAIGIIEEPEIALAGTRRPRS